MSAPQREWFANRRRRCRTSRLTFETQERNHRNEWADDHVRVELLFAPTEERRISLDSRCPECGGPYGFPLERANLPTAINEKRVVEGLNRGFYGAVFKTQHPRTGRFYAVKVIPVKTYAPKEEGGRRCGQPR